MALGNLTRPAEVASRRQLSLRVLAAGTVAVAVGLLAATFAGASHVEPELLPGASNQGKTCADNQGAGQSWVEFKPQPEPPPSGTYSDGTLEVTITYTAGKVFNWTSNIGVDAVIAKGGADGSYLYRYDPPQEATGDTGLTTPGQTGLSHITFCYDVESKIVVRKQTSPSGDAQSFDFTSNFAGGFSLSDGQQKDSGNVAPGTYSVSEAAVPGWDLTSATCSDGSSPSAIGLQAGETVTCTFVNTKRGRIIVKKEASPSNSGQSFDFTASYGSFSLAHGQENDSGLLKPGTYSVSETVPGSWALASATCSDGSSPSSIDLSAGETVTCTFVNTQLGKVIVEKTMNGGVDTFSFSGTPSGTISDNGGTISAFVEPGTYTSTEAPKEGWSLHSILCQDSKTPNSRGNVATRTATFRVEAGETVTCVFRNKKFARIIVKKVMNGGEGTFTFSGNPSGSISTNGGTISEDVEGNETYTSTEAPADGWQLTSVKCSDFNSKGDVATRTATFVVSPGEVVTCTFTNTKLPPKPGKIVVEKRTLPAGDPAEFDFTFGEEGFTLSDGQQEVFGDLDPGTYSVAEDVPGGWDLTSAVCDDESDPSEIELSEGETVTCVFTNTKRGTIIVEKRTSPANQAGSFTFTGDAAGSIGHGGKIVVSDLEPGIYTSTEAAVAGWMLTAIVCDDEGSSGNVGTRTATFDLGPGEIVTCVFTNAKVTVAQGSISVTKSANPTSLKEPGGPVTYSVTVTNTSNVRVTIENVVDDKFGDLDSQGGNGCFKVPFDLNPGASSSCQFTGNVTGPAGTVHVNTVTATGKDEFRNPVSASDDARVTITPRLIDLVIVKTATSPTPLNGTVRYTLTVTNKGPDTATNVQLADPAPAAIRYLTATASQGTCTVAPALVTCALGTIAPGQTVTVNVTARATAVGTHVNTATVTGSGGAETNPADNTDSAQTVVPRPITPPTPKPTPKPQPAICLTLTVNPKTITADSKPDKVRVLVTAEKKRQKGVKVVVKGAGLSKTGKTAENGVAVIAINPRKAGLLTVTVQERNRQACGAQRVGVVGVFLPPLTG